MTTGLEGGQPFVRIADNGRGIPRQDRKQIFRLFFVITSYSIHYTKLYEFASHRFLARKAHVTILGKQVKLTVRGEPLDASRHFVHREIKAVTAHAMAVERSPDGFLARFLVDV